MGALTPSAASRNLYGCRVGLLGFGEEERELTALVESAGCTCNRVPAEAGSSSLTRYDVLLVSATCEDAALLLPRLMVRKIPWVLVVTAHEVEGCSALFLHADEVIVRPSTGQEALFRISRSVHRGVGVVRPRMMHRSTVLVADDDPMALALIRSALDGYGFECHFASSGPEAVDQARILLPDLMLLDVDMPLMNGLEVLRSVREDAGTRNIRVLMVTASRDLRHIQTGSSLGADGYLVKPVDHLLLVSRVKRLLAPAPDEGGRELPSRRSA